MTVSNANTGDSGAQVTITAYRGVDSISFFGSATCITESSIVATVCCNLPVGELVSLRYSTAFPETLERHARVRAFHGDSYEFDLLLLADEEEQWLEEDYGLPRPALLTDD